MDNLVHSRSENGGGLGEDMLEEEEEGGEGRLLEVLKEVMLQEEGGVRKH